MSDNEVVEVPDVETPQEGEPEWVQAEMDLAMSRPPLPTPQPEPLSAPDPSPDGDA